MDNWVHFLKAKEAPIFDRNQQIQIEIFYLPFFTNLRQAVISLPIIQLDKMLGPSGNKTLTEKSNLLTGKYSDTLVL